MDTLAGRLPPLGTAAIRAALAAASESLGKDFLSVVDGVPEDFSLSGPSEARDPRNGTIVFIGSHEAAAEARARDLAGCLVIAPFEAWADFLAVRNLLARAKNPKYAYAAVAGALYPLAAWRGVLEREIGQGSWSAPDARIGKDTIVEPGVTVGRGARIGQGCILMHGCSIGPFVEIGDGSVVGEKAVVGDLGFGFAFDEGRPPLRLPQIGGVSVGKGVEIGAFATIGAGTMRPTIIEDHVKISDHVHIAHNCRIGAESILTCGVMVSGSAVIGRGCWLAPGAILRNGIALGAEVTVGMGAVVTGDVASGLTVMGIPARPVDRPAGKPVSRP